MLGLVMYLLVAQHPGAGASAWLPLNGEPDVTYRWSRPDSNTCLVEFAGQNKDRLSFSTRVKIVSSRPQAPVKTQSSSPLRPQATKITPQVSERRVSIQLFRMGRDLQRLNDCYGVDQVTVSDRKVDATPKDEPGSSARPK